MDSQTEETKKRTLSQLHKSELSWKFKSKLDFVTYLDQQQVTRSSLTVQQAEPS